MAIFLLKNLKIAQRLGALRELHRFAQHPSPLRRFSGKKNLPLGSSCPLTKSWFMYVEYYYV